jgi:hydroxyethylthiazole kinase-like sugar kinase family protein
MKDDLVHIFLDEAGQLEILVADLYTIFEQSFFEYKNFWHQLVDEEKNHASITRTIKDNPGLLNEFVSSSAPDLLQEILQTKELVSSLILKFSEKAPDRKTAFLAAIKIEKSAGEIAYQNFITQEADSWILMGLQKLNEYDRDHIERLEQYAKDNKIF